MADRDFAQLKSILDGRVETYNNKAFIADDPIAIPHRYTKLQDREIAGLWASVLAWGQRKTILAKAGELMDLMGPSPHDFIVNHKEKHRKDFLEFRHRTFQPIDTLYFLDTLQRYYRKRESLEFAFSDHIEAGDGDVMQGLIAFHNMFFNTPHAPQRTRKHISTPSRGSGCKRLNMFLRWMVRNDNKGVDFGIWKRIRPDQLIIPLDIHVQRVARKLGLLERKQSDWKAAVELTERLRKFDAADPVKYDFALFGMGVLEQGR